MLFRSDVTTLTQVARLPLVTAELDALLRQVARRDVDAFAAFYDQTRSRVFGLVRGQQSSWNTW